MKTERANYLDKTRIRIKFSILWVKLSFLLFNGFQKRNRFLTNSDTPQQLGEKVVPDSLPKFPVGKKSIYHNVNEIVSFYLYTFSK